MGRGHRYDAVSQVLAVGRGRTGVSLIERIRKALGERKLDPEHFEQAACALLKSRYPTLSPVEGGTDLGRDADIYRAIPDDPESRGRVLATTADPVANLRRSHKRWVELGLRVDQIVIACSRPVGGNARQKLDEYCSSHGLPLPEIYGRDWLVDELALRPDFRESLIGIRGRLEALSARPFGKENARTPFVGREETLTRLSAALAGDADVVLTGVPGVGKTRLLLELGEGLSWVEPRAGDHLADDLMTLAPDVVVVDDAHLHRNLVATLARLRVQESLGFTITAVTWPDRVEDLADLLPGATQVTVDLLPREEIDVVVQAAGVTGIHARHRIMDQAEGRPGWALALCDTAVRGEDKWVTGEALLEQVLRFTREAADTQTIVDTLACMAALNGCDQADLERVSHLVGVPSVDVTEAIQRLATNGLLEQRHGRWHLQPALRSPLVATWFFGERKHRTWTSLTTAFPEREHELIIASLQAAALFPDGAVAAQAEQWASTLPAADQWDEPVLDLLLAYSHVSEHAADFASRGAATVLAGPRPTITTPWGTTIDPLGIASTGILIACTRRWFNKNAVQGLLTLAVGDDRSRDQATDHPMRVLRDMARHVDPDRGTVFETRHHLLAYATEWLRSAPTPKRWPIFCEAVHYVFAPDVEGTWLDPARQRNVSFVHSVETADRLSELVMLWERVDQLLADVKAVEIPPQAVRALLDLLEDWLRLAGGHGPGPNAVEPLQRDVGAKGAWAIYRTLTPLITSRPGFALRAQRAVKLAERWDVTRPDGLEPLVLEEDLALLAGSREPDADIEDWTRQRATDATELANRLARLGPEDGTRKLASLAQEAQLAGTGADAGYASSRLAQVVDDREAWIDAARAEGLAALVYSLITGIQETGGHLATDIAETCLRDESTRPAVIRAVLEGGELDPTTQLVISQLEPADSRWLDQLCAKREADAVLHALLVHELPEVHAVAAISFRFGDKGGPALPSDWAPDWHRAFLDADHTNLRGPHERWRLREWLKSLATRQPELCARWFANRVEGPTETALEHRELNPIAAMLPPPNERTSHGSASDNRTVAAPCCRA